MFFIALCTFRPHLGFLAEQIASIRAQTEPDFRCLIQDDGSERDVFEAIQGLVKGDRRFQVRRNPFRLGVYHNFEAALAEAPPEAEFICYCDQDDLWQPHKLRRQAEVLADPGVALCHSDLELIDADGQTLHPSCFAFEGRNVEDHSLPQLLFRNSVTGCTTAFRSSLLPWILPFPHQGARPVFHHDLWTALMATMAGRIVALREPLVRYRQHGQNVIGAEPRDKGQPPEAAHRTLRQRLAEVGPRLRGYASEWQLRQRLIAEVFHRAPATPHPEARIQEVRAWMKTTGSLALYRYVAQHRDEEDSLARVGPRLFWGKLADGGLRFQTRVERAGKRSVQRLATVAVHLGQAALQPPVEPGQVAPPPPPPPPEPAPIREVSLQPRYAPLPLHIGPGAEPAINILIPSLSEWAVFGGVATACRLALGLSLAGRRVRLVTADYPLTASEIESSRAAMARVFAPEGPRRGDILGALDRIEILDGSSGSSASGKQGLPVSADDRFVTTAWGTVFRARETLRHSPFTSSRFIYLIQDYEPGFYAWSDWYALAASTYAGEDFLPIFNSTLLAEYFRAYVGVPVRPELILQPQIDLTRFLPPPREQLLARNSGRGAGKARRRMFVYGRPNVPRNLFGLLLQSLARWIADEGLSPQDLEVVSGGESFEPIHLGSGIWLRSLGKLSFDGYAEELRECDLGLSLMLSPHPSYPPLEMAAAGLVTVTNRFANKDFDALGVSGNLLSCAATEQDVAQGLRLAWSRLADVDARIAGARVDLAPLGQSMEHVVDGLLRLLDEPAETPPRAVRSVG